MIHSNGMKTSYTFDGRNLLTGIINTNPDGTNKKYYYNYDPEGLLARKQEPKGTTTYRYNGDKQLVSMTEPSGRVTGYTYDRAGNRRSQRVADGSDVTAIEYIYDSQNRLTATIEKKPDTTVHTDYEYDANGNQTRVVAKDSAAGTTKTDTYVYDELNQLTHISGSDGSQSGYTYYASGLRASKNVNGSTAVFTYDGTKLLTEQTAGQTKTNIHGTNLIATAGSDMLYYQYNNHGDVISVLDQAGEVKNEYDYDAFGNAITEKETVSNPYRYAGYYQDSESGLYYLQSRYYNPRTARFLTEDTASGKYTDPLSLNKYTYRHNQPVTGYDPDGHFLHIVAGAFIGAVVGGAVSAYSQYKSTGKVKLKKTVGAAVEGAVVGGVGAATVGASLGVTVAAGAAAGAAGNTANQLISTGKVNKKQVAVSAIGGAAGSAGAKLAGAAVNTGSKAASQAISKAAGNTGKQAAAKAGSSILGKTIAASAKGGIVGASAGASADLAMQVAKDKKHDIRNVNWKEVGGSALLGGGLGAGIGAVSQTKLGQKVSTSQQQWDAKLNSGIQSLKTNFKANAKALMADNRGMINLKAFASRRGTAGLSEGGTSTEVILPSKPHKNRTVGHWETILDEVDVMKQSGEYKKIYVNKGLSNEIPNAKPNRRPDIMGVRNDGIIDQVEVPSKTDNPKALIDRMIDNQRILGERAGSIKVRNIGDN